MSGYSNRIEGVNEYVSNYEEKYKDDFEVKADKTYKDKLATFNAAYGGIETDKINEVFQKKNMNEQIPLFMGMGASALESSLGKRTVREVGSDVSSAASRVGESAVAAGENLVSRATTLGESIGTSARAVGESIGTSARAAVGRVSSSIPETASGFGMVDRAYMEPLRGMTTPAGEGASRLVTTDAAGVRSGNLVEADARGMSGMNMSDLAAADAATDAGTLGARVGAKIGEKASAFADMSLGTVASAGAAGLGAGFEGYEAGESITGSKYGGIAIGGLEALGSVIAPEIAVPLMIGDVIAEGFSSLFHHHSKIPPAPKMPNLTPKIPAPSTALSRGDIAVPVYDPSN